MDSFDVTAYAELYQPLNSDRSETRLVHIESGNENDDIQCRLSVISLDDNVEFDALSYVWGDPTDTSTISIDGKPFQATHNLIAAIRRLRAAQHDIPLWIDAVCINQSDRQERSQQVGQMARIYQSARRVYAHLNVPDRESQLAATAIMEMSRDGGSHLVASKQQDEGREAINTEHVEAMTVLFKSRWFSRVWTLQEAILAPDLRLMAGDAVIPLAFLYMAVYNISYHLRHCCFIHQLGATGSLVFGISLLNLIKLTGNVIAIGGASTNPALRPQSFYRAVTKFAGREAFDPRDQIYGLMGILPAAFTRHVTVNYSSSVSSVFEQAVVADIEETRGMGILSLKNHEPQRVPDLPSWVPDLSAACDWTRTNMRTCFDRFHASRAAPACVDARSSRSITLRGIRIDHISAVGHVQSDYPLPPIPPKDAPLTGNVHVPQEEVAQVREQIQANPRLRGYLGHAALIQNWRAVACLPEDPEEQSSPEHEERTFRFCCALGNELIDQLQTSDHIRGTREQLLQGYRYYGTQDTDPAFLLTKPVETGYASSAERVLTDERFFVCGGGAMGTGSVSLEVGDVVVLLYGGVLPFILRKAGAGEARYRLVGDCYLSGMMDGEAIDAKDNGLLREESFVLI